MDWLAVAILVAMIVVYCLAGTMDYEDRVNNLNNMMPTEGWYLYD